MNPPRRYTDYLVSCMGVVAVIGLLIAGGLALWAHNYVSDQVGNQLASQQITFPQASAIYPCATGVTSEDCFPQYASEKAYAGQKLTTGDQAREYADVQLQNDLNAIAGGKTYAQLSAASLADPSNAKLSGLVAVIFKGTALKGLLLNGYAFGTIATIAGWSAVAAFVGAGLMLILTILGVLHGAGRIGRKSEEPTATA
jgi:hypothetical protein